MLNSLSLIPTWLDISLVTRGLDHPVCCDFARIIEYEVQSWLQLNEWLRRQRKRCLGSTNASTMDATRERRGSGCKSLKGKETAKTTCELIQNIESKSHLYQQLSHFMTADLVYRLDGWMLQKATCSDRPEVSQPPH